MKNNLQIKNNIIIPANELEITVSRAGGAGGQHVNKVNTKVTIKWNVNNTNALTQELKDIILQKLNNILTVQGELIVQNSSSRSQKQNKEKALLSLAQIVRKALYIPKERKSTTPTKTSKEMRLQEKSIRSKIKKMRNKKINYD